MQVVPGGQDLSPRERAGRSKAARSREKLLLATKGLLASGVSEPTVDAIVDRAQVSVNTLYAHWPSKSDLVDAARTDLAAVVPGDDAVLALAEGTTSEDRTQVCAAALAAEEVGLFESAARMLLRAANLEQWNRDLPPLDRVADLRHADSLVQRAMASTVRRGELRRLEYEIVCSLTGWQTVSRRQREAIGSARRALEILVAERTLPIYDVIDALERLAAAGEVDVAVQLLEDVPLASGDDDRAAIRSRLLLRAATTLWLRDDIHSARQLLAEVDPDAFEDRDSLQAFHRMRGEYEAARFVNVTGLPTESMQPDGLIDVEIGLGQKRDALALLALRLRNDDIRPDAGGEIRVVGGGYAALYARVTAMPDQKEPSAATIAALIRRVDQFCDDIAAGRRVPDGARASLARAAGRLFALTAPLRVWDWYDDELLDVDAYARVHPG